MNLRIDHLNALRRFLGIVLALVPFVLVVAIGLFDLHLPRLISSFAGAATIASMIGYACFAMGALACCANFYLSYVRYPIHRLLFGSAQYRWISGLPLFGTVLLVIGFFAMLPFSYSTLLAVVLLTIDTAGPLWFVMTTWHDDSLWGARAKM
jgi:hypothetical protein